MCAGGRQVVHRAADGQFADVAAGKENRVDHITVGGESQTVFNIENRGVVHLRKQGVVQRADEVLHNQVVGQLAAAAVG